MTYPLQITFRHMPPSRFFENRIHELARRFEKFSTRISHCHVVIERPHATVSGEAFDVSISLNVPNCVIVVKRAHAADPRHKDAYIALRDAFNTAKRRLQEYERMSRGEVKTHIEPSVAQEPASVSSS